MNTNIPIIYPANELLTIGDFPPLGGLYIVSFLKQQGIEANYYDFPMMKNWKKTLYEIINSNPSVIGLGSTVSNFANTNYLAKYLKSINKNIKIIVGGPYPTCVPEKYLANRAIDAVCIGEGEHTFYRYLIEGDKADGLMVRRENQLFQTRPRARIENLDDLPFPDLTQVDLKKYWYLFQRGKPLSSIVTSRGCPYRCIYCFHEVHGHKWRARSPKNVIKEIEWQVNELGVGELGFWDDNLTLDQKRAETICDLIIQKKLKVSMCTPNGVRVDKINKNLLSKMKDAGFWVIILTPETGDPNILKKLNKEFTLEQTEKAAKWCKDLGFFLVVYLMMGLPFETIENARNSVNFINKIKPDLFNVNKFYPFPKTPIVEDYNLKTNEGSLYRNIQMSKDFEKTLNSAYFQFFSNPYNIWNLYKKVGSQRFFSTIIKMFGIDFWNRIRRIDYSKLLH